MPFPFQLSVECGGSQQQISFNSGTIALLGPNGTGKTQLLRKIKVALETKFSQEAEGPQKVVRFISAGRMGLDEHFRSNYDGGRGSRLRFDAARYGSKDDISRRNTAETVKGDILTLSERPDLQIKIRERLRKIFNRDFVLEWDKGSLKLSFVDLESNTQYSSGREASGLMHVVSLMTAIYNDEVGALLIDEPEVSLHPQLQAFLQQQISTLSQYPEPGSNKKIIVIATHSTEFVTLRTTRDLASLVFCSGFNEAPKQISNDDPILQNRKLNELVSRVSQEHKKALFVSTPVLVEGPSDALICSAVSYTCSVNLEAGGAQIVPVIGKGEFPTVLKLFRLMGKRPVVLADADGFTDALELVNCYLQSAKADDLAAKQGYGAAVDLSRQIYSDFCQLAEVEWGAIAPLAEQHNYFDANSEDVQKNRRRAALAALFSNTDEEIGALEHVQNWQRVKTRLTVLFEILEALGCFILRKGTIENYYTSVILENVTSKPAAAVDESQALLEFVRANIKEAYGDVLRCLSFASCAQELDETTAILDLLLACVGPLQQRMRDGNTDGDPNQIIKETVGENAKLFHFEWAEARLKVTLKSAILDVNGFPIEISSDDDAGRTCRTQMEI